jgi:hypothetical protein
MVINAWVFDEEGEMHDRLIDLEDLKLFGIIPETEERSNDVLGRGRDDD